MEPSEEAHLTFPLLSWSATFPDGTIPITPLRRCWSSSGGGECSRLQLPLKLAWAVTIHKSQGLTMDKVVIDVSKREFSTGLTFVACSRVRQLQDLLFTPPFTYQRLASLSNSCRLKGRQEEVVFLLFQTTSTSRYSITHSPYVGIDILRISTGIQTRIRQLCIVRLKTPAWMVKNPANTKNSSRVQT